MVGDRRHAEAVVLGGGFYGCKVAIALKTLGLRRVVLVEPEELGSLATTANQNRVHGGYHYPRSLVTAASAQKNYLRFLADHAATIDSNRRHLYAIAEGSKTTPEEFVRVCNEIGAPYMFNTGSMFTNEVAAVLQVDEVTFNIERMQTLLKQQLKQARVEVIKAYGTIKGSSEYAVNVDLERNGMQLTGFTAEYVFNCTYASIDQVGVKIATRLKKEYTEVALVDVNGLDIADTDITVMDGPYWSLMRYPARDCHALTHVAHTPHFEWFPPKKPALRRTITSNAEKMIADAARFVPEMAQARYIDSLWTTRVVLADNENDDGRPVLWEYAAESPRIISILGSKFNSIYDVLEKLASGEWRKTSHVPSLRVVGRRALVGRGFVGSTLDKEGRFTDRYNSENIEEMSGHYQSIVIAAPSAEKWRANADSDADMDNILQLQDVLGRVTADEVTLISTIDARLQEPYGFHRLILEDFVRARWSNAKVIRLPALFGDGLKKNVLFDIATDKPLRVHPDSTFQWYDMRDLWGDIWATKPGERREFFPAPIPVRWLLEQLGRNPAAWESLPLVRYEYKHEDGTYDMPREEVERRLLKWFNNDYDDDKWRNF